MDKIHVDQLYIDIKTKDVIRVEKIINKYDLQISVIHDPDELWELGKRRMTIAFFKLRYVPYEIADTPLWRLLNGH